MSYKLSVMFEGRLVERHEFDQDRVVVGRSQECDVPIDNLGISRKHAEIIREGSVHVLRDLKSNNGTYVNGKRIRVHNLNDGEEIGVGKFTLVFSCPDQKDQAQDIDVDEDGQVGGMTMAIDKTEMDRQQADRMSAIKGHLVVGEEPDKRTVFLDQAVFTIGSEPSCDLRLKGGWLFRKVQPKHAIIFRDATGFRLIDTSQKKATYVNGNSIDDERLKDGDVIQIGKSQLTYMVGTPVL